MTINLLSLRIGDFVEFLRPNVMAKSSAQPEHPIELSDTAKWYCAVVRPGCHARAELELARLGFRSFYPRTRRWVSHARTKKAVEKPILGRYIFVEVDHPRQSFGAVSNVFDIESIVSVTNIGNPTPFPAHWVEGLLRRYLAGEWDEIINGKLPVGARIRVVEGEFNEKCGTITSSKANRVNVKILGQKQDVRLNQCSVRAA